MTGTALRCLGQEGRGGEEEGGKEGRSPFPHLAVSLSGETVMHMHSANVGQNNDNKVEGD